MFNVAVFKLKDIIKYLFCLVAIMLILYTASRYFFSHKEKEKTINIGEIIKEKSLDLIDIQYPQIERIKKQQEVDLMNNEVTEEVEEDFAESFLTGLIKMELSITDKDLNIEKADNFETKDAKTSQESSDNDSTESDDTQNNTDENLELAKSNIATEVVTESPLSDAYTNLYEGVKIKNETSYTLSDDILNPNNLNINSNNIIIFHTHTCESYTSSEEYSYTPTGNYRTTDLNYTVARVGDELSKYLGAYGFNVTHDKTYHDYPSYTGSYTRSLATVQEILKQTSSDIIIDLHRDAIGARPDYAPTVRIGDEYVAQIMFVIGTNGGGLYHPNWSSNLQFAVKIQKVANQMYPGLFKPIILRNSRYNQHLGKAACIIEVGSTGNTLKQCLNSMKYFSNVMNEALIDN